MPNKLNIIEKIYAPTDIQKTLLNNLLNISNEYSGEYIEQLLVDINGNLNIELFEKSWEILISRHEILRSAFAWKQLDEIKQVVLKQISFKIKLFDLKNHAKKEQNKFIKNTINEDSIIGYNLNKAPLFRVYLFIINKKYFKILYSFHHVIIDGHSIGILFMELSQVYNNLQNNIPINLSKTTSYHSYVNWLNSQQNNETHIDFWKKEIINANITNIPNSLKPLNKPKNKYGSLSNEINNELLEQVNNFCKQNHITLNTFISSIWAILLQIYTQQDIITYGNVYSIRPIELNNSKFIIGPLINTIPITVAIENEKLYYDFIQSLQMKLISYQSNSYLSLDNINKLYFSHNKYSKQIITHNLFDFILAFEKFSNNHQYTKENKENQLNKKEISIKKIEIFEKINLPLAMICYPETNKLTFKILFHKDKVDEYYAQNIINQLIKLIEITVKSDIEKTTIMDIKTKFCRTLPISRGKKETQPFNLNDFIHHYAKTNPNQIAIIDKDKKINYLDLSKSIKNIAEKLPIKNNDVIGVYLPRSINNFILALAIFEKGGCYLALNDKLPKERLEFIIKDANIKNIIGNKTNLSGNYNFISYESLLKNDNTSLEHNNNNSNINPNHWAYIVYTSGSTGTPKGVINTYKGLKNFCIFCDEFVPKNEVVIQFASISFDASILEMCLAFVSCSTLVIIPEELRTNIKEIEDFISKNNITVAFLTTAISTYLTKSKLPKLKKLFTGGEACPETLAENWSKDCLFYNVYGPSETAMITSYNPFHETKHPTAIGYPVPNVNFTILTKDNLIAPPGVIGELLIEGDSVGAGYINNKELNEKSFINNGYKTGDYCYQDKNNLTIFVERIDEQIKINGQRIEIGEIEKVLAKNPKVIEAVVIANKIEQSSTISLHAFVRHINIDKENLANYLISYLRKFLPDYMIPRNYYSVDNWTLNNSSKIDKNILKQQIKTLQKNNNIEVSTDTEKIIVKYFKELFNDMINKDTYYKDDNFFNLGGNSIILTTLILKLNKHFKINIPVQIVYDYPEIENLAKYIDKLLVSPKASIYQEINLNNEVAEAIKSINMTAPKINEIISLTKAKKIIITGAAGFIGMYLTRELLDNTNAKIICFVRSKNNLTPTQRIINVLKDNLLLKNEDLNRITAYGADLFKKEFGLPKEIYNELAKDVDIIYHCGANVNLVESYASMSNDNITATKNIIDFANAYKLKKIHYTSTISIIYPLGIKQGIVTEKEEIPYQMLDPSGYTKTKWVAEKIFIEAQKKGVPINIYRIPRIWGSSITGVSNPKDALIILIWASILIKSMPINWMMNKADLHLMPVDYLVKLIISISKNNIPVSDMYHVIYPIKVSMNEITNYLKKLGYHIEITNPEIWLQKINDIVSTSKEDNIIKSAFGILSTMGEGKNSNKNELIIDCTNTNKAIENNSINTKPFIPELINKYINYLMDKHNFPRIEN